jgi:hypothetical protein
LKLARLGRHRGLRLAAFYALAAVPLLSYAKDLSFEEVFGDKGEPSALHYEATYLAGGKEHRVEVWRDGGRRLKRRTDGTVEVYVFREPNSAEFRMSILDLHRRIHTRIDRTNLYRLGTFTDWSDLAHGLRHPKGEYRLVSSSAPGEAGKPIDECHWYDLTQGRRTVHICWNARDHLPLLIQGDDGQVAFRVAACDRRPAPKDAFEIHDQGFVKNDANEDIEGD